MTPDKERYATIGTWVEVFRKEGVLVSDTYIRKLMKRAGVIGFTARNKTGRLLRDSFFPESAVREKCRNMFEILPKADNEGCIIFDGKRYSTVAGLSRLIGLSEPIIAQRLKVSRLESISGRDSMNHVCDFYPESEVRQLFHEHLKKLPQTDEQGFITIGSVNYGTAESFSRQFEIGAVTLLKKIRGASIPSVRGKLLTGNLADFYPEPAVRDLCSAYIERLPRADEEGYIELEGVRYATAKRLSAILDISQKPVQDRIASSSLKPVRGLPPSGAACDFYSEQDVRSLCQDFLKEIPEADAENSIYIDGVRYLTCGGFARQMGVSKQALVRRLENSHLSSIRGKTKNGRIRTYYSESELNGLCEGLSEELPLADADGFLMLDGLRYGTVHRMAQEFGVSERPLLKRIVASSIKSVRGRLVSRNVADFYLVSEVRMLCTDLIAKRNKDR